MSKFTRYKNIFNRVINWPQYLFMKMVGFKASFSFRIKDFGAIEVEKSMLGPFRENFFDDAYFKHIPDSVLANKPNPVIIDIGANVGFFSLATFSRFPGAELYSFEPHPYCFKVMSDYKNAFGKYNWNINQKAVSDQNGELTLNTSTVSGFTTKASVYENDVEKAEEFVAQAIKFDTFLSENNITHIDFMKLDCEGAEFSILYGLTNDVFEMVDSFSIEAHKGEKENQNINALNEFIQTRGYSTKIQNDGYDSGYIWAWKPKYNAD